MDNNLILLFLLILSFLSVIIGVFEITELVPMLKANIKRNNYNPKLTVKDLLELQPTEFEHFCKGVLWRLGFQDLFVTDIVGDGGKDIIGYRDGLKYYFECKRYAENSKITHQHIANLHSASVQDRAIPMVITTGDIKNFTKNALFKINANEIRVILNDELIAMYEGNQIIDNLR